MNREILRLAIPNVISNVSVPLLSTVDTVLMGHLSGLHLGAVGIGAMIFNFLYWNFVFLRMGTTGLTAQSYGRNSHGEMASVLGRALLTAALLGLLLILIQQPFWQIAARLMNVTTEHFPLVKTYFTIRVFAAPATLMLYVLMGWFFGMQNALFPLWITLFLNLLNIGVSMLLVLHFGMEVKGVAFGTLGAQYAGVLLAVFLLFSKYRFILQEMKLSSVMIWEEFRQFFSVNRDIFLRTICLSLVFSFFYSQSSLTSGAVLASTVILLQFLNWMSYGIDGFAFAAESLTGKYYGAGNDLQLTKTIRYSLYWGAGLGLGFTLFYGLGKGMLIRLFTSDPEVIQATQADYYWIILLPLIAFSSYIWDGIFVGLTAAKSMRDSMFISFLVYFLLFILLRHWLGHQALWIALLGFLFSRGLIQTLLYLWKGKALK